MVAPVCPSGLKNLKKYGVGHVVMCIGNEINKKTRPTRAGLKMFFPNPPKQILAMIIGILLWVLITAAVILFFVVNSKAKNLANVHSRRLAGIKKLNEKYHFYSNIHGCKFANTIH